MQSDDAEIGVRPAPTVQSSSVQAAQSEKVSDEMFLCVLATLSKANGIGLVQHGARVAVIGELLVSLITHLPVSTREDIGKSFRDRIEDLMSLSDDMGLPEKYHSALLSEVNRYLNALR